MSTYLQSRRVKCLFISIALLAALAVCVGALRAADSAEPDASQTPRAVLGASVASTTEPRTESTPAGEEEDPRAILGNVVVDDTPSAEAILADTDALWSKGAMVDAVLGYLDILDEYPDSKLSAVAEERLRSMANDAEATSEGDPAVPAAKAISAQDLAEVDAKLPAFDKLKSARAKQMISYFCQVKGDCMAEMGMKDEANLSWRQCIGTVIATMYDHPDAALNIEGPRLALRIAKKVGPEQIDLTIKSLEALVTEVQPSVATWVAHYALADHYLHNKGDRRTGEQHLKAVYDGTKAGLIDAALVSPWAKQKGTTHMHWAAGWAEYELGHYGEAIARFEKLATTLESELAANPNQQLQEDREVAEKYADWAAFTIATATQRLNPTDDTSAIQAYQDFLDNSPDNVCADFARVELGRLRARNGELEAALALYRAVGDKHPEARTMAERGIAEVSRLTALASQ